MGAAKDYFDSQAQRLIDAVSLGTGQIPNSQIIHEALASQSVEAVAQAGLSGDPVLSQLLQEAPQPGSNYSAPSGHSLNPRGRDFTWDAYWNTQKSLPDEEKNQFRDIGGVPVADPTFMTDILNRIHNGDQRTAKNWQTLLNKTGHYYSQSDDPNAKVSVVQRTPDGIWTPADEQAYLIYFQDLARPFAIHSTDEKKAPAVAAYTIASQRLGDTTDITQLPQTFLDDPKNQWDMASRWMFTHPDQSDQRHLISTLTDLIGDANVPKAMRDANWDIPLWKKIIDAPAEAVDIPVNWGIDALNAVAMPVRMLPHLWGGSTMEGIGSLDPYAPDKAEQTRLIERETTPNQRQQIIGALQDVKASQGYLETAQQASQRFGNRAALIGMWALGAPVGPAHLPVPIFGALEQIVRNPGDTLNHVWDWAAIHQDQFAGAVINDTWAKDNPFYASVFNFVSAFMTDPTNLAGPVARAGKLGHDLAGIGKILDHAAIADNEGLRATLTPTVANRFKYAANPHPYMQNLARQILPEVAVSPKLSAADRWSLFDALNHQESMDVINSWHSDDHALLPHVDADFIRGQMQQYFPTLSLGGLHYNLQSHLRALSPEIQRRLDAGGIQAMMTAGGFLYGHKALDLDNKFGEAVVNLREKAYALGMDITEVDKALFDMATNQDTRRETFEKLIVDMKKKMPEEYWQQLAAKHADLLDAKKVPGEWISKHSYVAETSPFATQQARALDDYQRQINDMLLRQRDLLPEEITAGDPSRLKAFVEDPKNTDFLDRLKKDWDDLESKMDEVQIQKQTSTVVPGTTSGFAMLPFSTYDIVSWRNPVLRWSEQNRAVQAYERAMSIWKLWEIAKPSTALRAAIGDDIMRWSIDLAFWGAPEAALDAIWWKRVKTTTAAPLHIANTMLRDVYRGVKAMATGHDPALLEAIADPRLADPIRRIVDNPSVQDVGALDPGDNGYAQGLFQALHNAFRNGTKFAQKWAENMDKKEPGRARRAIMTHYTSDFKRQERARLDTGKVNTSLAARLMGEHGEIAAQIRSDLAEADSKAARHPITGAILSNNDFRALYSGLPKRSRFGQQFTPAARNQSYRDRVVARLHYHEAASNSAGLALIDTVDHTHHLLSSFFRHPDLRTAFATGNVTRGQIEAMLAGPDRDRLPQVQSVIDGPEYRRQQRFGPTSIPNWMMKRTMARMIPAARASGAERIRQWYYQFYKHQYGDHDAYWTEDRINSRATAHARDYMMNNTYQGTRHIADAAMGKIFPFYGATASMNRFLLKQVKTRPWLLGPISRVAAWAEQGENDPYSGVDMNPLSWFGWMGKSGLTVHPANIFFLGGEGYASIFPGAPPAFGLLTPMLSQDSGVRRVLEQTPWGAHIYGPGQVAASMMGSLPAYLRHTVNAAVDLAGVPAGVTGQEAQQAKVTRELAASEGHDPTQEEVHRRMAEEEAWVGATGFVLPILPSFKDPIGYKVDTEKRKLRAAQTEKEREAIYTDPNNKDIEVILKSLDPRLSGEEVGALESAYPEIIPYRTSLFRSGPGEQEAYTDPTVGLPYKSVGEYNASVLQERENAIGWPTLRYARTLVTNHLKTTGEAPSSADYKIWYENAIRPIYDDLKNNQRMFYDQYIAQAPKRDVVTEAANSDPISALSSVYALPQVDALETTRSVKFRNIMLQRDAVAHEIVSLRNGGVDPSVIQQVLAGFHQTVMDLTKDDPQFADQMDMFHWSKWTDFVDLEVQQLEQQQRGY